MARVVKLLSSERTDWDSALALHREQLRFYLDYLLQCECGQEILASVETEVRERFVPDDFKLRFLVRSLVRNVIQHLRECAHERNCLHRPAGDSNPLAETPAQERLVYFMRDILEYSTRDTSLLIGITDAQVEDLLKFARKRIDMKEGPSSLEIQSTEWTYFRWKFDDLHPI